MATNFENPEVFMGVARTAAARYPYDDFDVKLLAFPKTRLIWYTIS